MKEHKWKTNKLEEHEKKTWKTMKEYESVVIVVVGIAVLVVTAGTVVGIIFVPVCHLLFICDAHWILIFVSGEGPFNA